MHSDLDLHMHECVALLRKLPAVADPPYNWQEFQRQARLRDSSQPKPVGRRHAVVAAVLVVAAFGLAVWGGTSHRVVTGPDGPGALTALSAAGESQQQLASGQSRVIESWLASLPAEPALVRVGTRAAVATLEDRIAEVDDLLTSVSLDGPRSANLVALQQERVRLIGSLAQVRYAESLDVGLP